MTTQQNSAQQGQLQKIVYMIYSQNHPGKFNGRKFLWSVISSLACLVNNEEMQKRLTNFQ